MSFHLDLRLDEHKAQDFIKGKRIKMTLLVALLLFLSTSFYLSLNRENAQLSEEMYRLRQQQAQLSREIEESTMMEWRYFDDKETYVHRLSHERIYWSQYLSVISSSIPDRMTLQTIAAEKNHIKVTGTSLNVQDILIFNQGLTLRGVVLESQIIELRNTGDTFYFTISILLETPDLGESGDLEETL